MGDGVRESEASWKKLLLELKGRGMSVDPKLAIADGALAFWKAFSQVFPDETETHAQKAFAHFCEGYRDRYPKAVETLEKDRELLMTFYRFPASHWKHIRSTNVIEIVFATVRLRTYKTKGLGTRNPTLAMAFKLTQEAEKR